LYTPREIVDEISPYETAKIGFVFGRENNGLSNDELSSCNYQSTIPSAVSYPALNLSQAVMVYAHELYLASTRITPVYDWTLASKSDQERLYTMIHDAVETLPFKTRNGTAAFVNLFRRVLGRTKIEARDIRVLYKLFDLIKRK
ncbi:hypothetical protein EBR96_09565, partial [bacterium]|nr:hypothetical protein [bacterium]